MNFRKKLSPKTMNNRPSRPPTMFAAHFIFLFLVRFGLGLREIEEKRFGILGGGEGDRAGRFGAGGIAGEKADFIGSEFAFDELQPQAATVFKIVADGFTCFDFHAIDIGVLMDGCGIFTTICGDHEDFWIGFGISGWMPLGVGGLESVLVRLDPDLQEVKRLGA